VRVGGAATDAADTATYLPDVAGLGDLEGALAVGAALLVIAVILIPLLLFGIELIVLGLVLAASILGRGLLGRPWVVEATPTGDPAGILLWRVVGWRRSGRLIDEIAGALRAGIDPPQPEVSLASPPGVQAPGESSQSR
jgi:hypothetical protein